MSVYSMTGFATVSGTGFTLTAKSVNHRFLDLQIRVPSGCEMLEALLRAIVRGAVRRGHVEVSLEIERTASSVVTVRRNDDLLAALVRSHREAEELHGLLGDPDLNVLLRVPGVIVAETGPRVVDPVAIEAEVAVAAADLMERFNAARGAEGESLAEGMHQATDRLAALVEEMAALRVGVREAQMARFRERLAAFEIPEERIMTEAAIVAEKSDVEEEIVRLRTHARSFQAILAEGGEVGKRLDFLLQEMNREANTMVSKVNGALGERGLRLTDVGLAMKGEIERVKEQVQNLE